MLRLDDESQLVKNYLLIKDISIYVLGCLLGWVDEKFAAKNIYLPHRLTSQDVATHCSWGVKAGMTNFTCVLNKWVAGKMH